jgi:hypothetical protein
MNARTGAVGVLLAVSAAWAAEAAQSAPAGSQPAGEKVVLADFGSGTDGFRGDLQHDATVGHGGKGSGRMGVDFAARKGPAWITAGKVLNLRRELRAVRFWVRSGEASGLTVRLVDDTGQAHQQRPVFQANGQWQLVELTTFDKGRGYERWGGANDGKFHWPAREIAFSLEKGNLGGKAAGTIWIDDVEAVADPRPFVPELELSQAVLGNVFLTNEKVRLPLASRGRCVRWTVTDFWQAKVAEGEVPVRDGAAVVEPPEGLVGYFDVHLAAHDAHDAKLAEARTTFAVIMPAEPTRTGPYTDPNTSPFGVMTHFAQGWDTDIMPLIRRAGIASIRDEHYWQQVEAAKGKFDFPDRFTAYMAEAKRLWIAPLVVMTFENSNYDGGLTPHTPEGCQAYGRYGQELIRKFGRQVRWMEVWNEYNGSWCKGPAATDRPKYYAQMLKSAYEAVKAERPGVQVLGGAAVLLPRPWFEGIFRHDGLKYMDGVVIHPYRDMPEGVDEEIRELKDLMRKYNGGQTKPIWVTETGKGDEGPDGRRNVARYLARMYTLLLSEGCQKVYWYLLRDYAEFRTMGLLHDATAPEGRYAAAPAYVAYANLIRQLREATFVRRETFGLQTRADMGKRQDAASTGEPTDPQVRVYLFRHGVQEIRVCWATAPAGLVLQADAPLGVVDLVGKEVRIDPVGGEAYLTLTDNPVYVLGRIQGLARTGRVHIEPEQSVDVQGQARLRVTLDANGSAAPLEGRIASGVRSKPFFCEGRQRKEQAIPLPEVDTATTGAQTYWYRLLMPNPRVPEGSPLTVRAGLGGVRLNVVDPLAFRPAVPVWGDGTAEVVLANGSAQTAYTAESVTWRIGPGPDRQGERTESLRDGLRPREAVVLRLPTGELPPYRAVPARVTVRFNARPPAVFRTELSDNPIFQRTVNVNGVLDDWRDMPAMELGPIVPPPAAAGKSGGAEPPPAASGEPKAWLAWDAKKLYLAVRVTEAPPKAGEAVTLALAPADLAPVLAVADRESQKPANARWYEFRLPAAGPATGLTCTLAPNADAEGPAKDANAATRYANGGTAYELAVPWSRLGRIAPLDGALRLAVLLEYRTLADQPAIAGWGGGIYYGKDQQAMRLCRLEEVPAAGAAAGGTPGPTSRATRLAFSLVRLPTPSPSVPAPAAKPAPKFWRVLADSMVDYSNVQGKAGWSYGYYAGDGGGQGDAAAPTGPYTDDDFRPMNYVETVWGYTWAGPMQYLSLDRGGGHPQVRDGRQVWAVRRWKSPAAGVVRITGTIRRNEPAKGDGTGAKVLVDGLVVHSAVAGGPDHPRSIDYQVLAAVKEGSLVDFALTPGAGVNTDFDAATFTARVEMAK